LQEALAGPHGALLHETETFIAALPANPKALIAFVEAQDWRPLDADTRYIALRRINAAILGRREAQGLPPFDDPLPGAPDNAWQRIKRIIEFPAEAGEAPTGGVSRSNSEVKSS
jgi:hypothetical protein